MRQLDSKRRQQTRSLETRTWTIRIVWRQALDFAFFVFNFSSNCSDCEHWKTLLFRLIGTSEWMNNVRSNRSLAKFHSILRLFKKSNDSVYFRLRHADDKSVQTKTMWRHTGRTTHNIGERLWYCVCVSVCVRMRSDAGAVVCRYIISFLAHTINSRKYRMCSVHFELVLVQHLVGHSHCIHVVHSSHFFFDSPIA